MHAPRADNRKPHRLKAEEELCVFDCLEAVIGRDVRRAAAEPAGAIVSAYFACWGTYPGGNAAPSPKKNSSICLATSSCASFCHGMRRYSLRIIFIRSSQSFQASAEILS